MTRIVLSPSNVAAYPDGGGHFWVGMQYVLGLTALGCDVYWLEEVPGSFEQGDRGARRTFIERMQRFGLEGKALLYQRDGADGDSVRFVNVSDSRGAEVLRGSDLLLNFHYSIPERLLSLADHTALLDIDPGLLQFWMATGQIDVPRHDDYVTIGETVGVAGSKIEDVGVSWKHIQPPVYLPAWPFSYRPDGEALTTVSGWWGGGGKGEWITDGKQVFFENNKRVTFLDYVDLPSQTAQPLELALALGEGDEEGAGQEHDHSWVPEGTDKDAVTDYVSDAVDRRMLESRGWRIRRATEVASTPEAYRAYIQQSRGEFSCAKPSCMYFQNAWVSDRTICYLASGKPVVLQDTGPSSILPNGEGIFRFQTMAQAVEALEVVNADYGRQCDTARAIAETHFDSVVVLRGLLNDIFAG